MEETTIPPSSTEENIEESTLTTTPAEVSLRQVTINEHVLLTLDVKSVQRTVFPVAPAVALVLTVKDGSRFKVKLVRRGRDPEFTTDIEAFVQYAQDYEDGIVDYKNPNLHPVPNTEVVKMIVKPIRTPQPGDKRVKFEFEFKDNPNDVDFVILVRDKINGEYEPYEKKGANVSLYITM